MTMSDLRNWIIGKERVEEIGKGVELFFFEITQKIIASPLPRIYHAGFVVDFEKGKMSYTIASLFRENEKNSNSILINLIYKISKLYGFEWIVPLNKDGAEYKQLTENLSYEFEAVYVKINLIDATLPTSIFGDWQSRARASIEKHVALGKAANKIEQIVIDEAYKMIQGRSRTTTAYNPNLYRKIALELNQY